MNTFSWIFIAAALFTLGLRLWLAGRQVAHLRSTREQVPEAFTGDITVETNRKAADYTAARVRLGRWELLYGTALMFVWTLGGGLRLLDDLWSGWRGHALLGGVAVMLSVFLISALVDLPWSAYETFSLEERFGFNKTTPATFVLDALKGGLLLVILGGPVALAALWFMQRSGALWWLYVWLLWQGFTLLLTWLYPAVIAPLFNRFRPLEEGDLRSRIEALLARCGFASKGVFVMDGSRRSAHGNAYFTGIGNHKRIVFFDTLMETLTGAEIEAVMAHELGHFRLRHVTKSLFLNAAMSFIALAALGWLAAQPWFYAGLGVRVPSNHAALLLFLLASPAFTFLFTPLLSARSRKHEYEADAYAAAHADAGDLTQALVKLYRENATSLNPDPVYSRFYDSHPPAVARISNLRKLADAR